MKKPTVGEYALYGIVRTIMFVLRIMPLAGSLAVARGLARLYFRFDHRHRAIALRNLDIAFHELSVDEKMRIARGSYENLGELVVLVSKMPSFMNPDRLRKIIRYEGLEYFREMKTGDTGVLALTGHLGCWELLSFGHAVLTSPIHFIVRPLNQPLLDNLLNRNRALPGNVAIPKRQAARRVLRFLSRGEDVGILVDQNVQEKDGVFVDFFGKRACMTTGLAILALKSGAPVMPAFLVPDHTRQAKYVIRLYPEVPLVRSGDLQADIAENTQRFATVLEDVIRHYPDRWLWAHRRWRTRPADDPVDPYAGI